jgi:hypothetical protein
MSEQSKEAQPNPNEGLNFQQFFGGGQSNRKREAVNNDRRLQDLVTYELTKGLTIPMEEVEDTTYKFAEYKRRIMLGSFTLEQLEEMTLSKYAMVKPMPNPLDEIEFMEVEPEGYPV